MREELLRATGALPSGLKLGIGLGFGGLGGGLGSWPSLGVGGDDGASGGGGGAFGLVGASASTPPPHPTVAVDPPLLMFKNSPICVPAVSLIDVRRRLRRPAVLCRTRRTPPKDVCAPAARFDAARARPVLSSPISVAAAGTQSECGGRAPLTFQVINMSGRDELQVYAITADNVQFHPAMFKPQVLQPGARATIQVRAGGQRGANDGARCCGCETVPASATGRARRVRHRIDLALGKDTARWREDTHPWTARVEEIP